MASGLVSYTSDSDDEKWKDEEAEERGVEEKKEQPKSKADDPTDVFETATIHSVKSSSSLVSYGLPDMEKKGRTGLVSYEGGDDDEGKRADESAEMDVDFVIGDHDESWADEKPSSSGDDELQNMVKVENMAPDGASLSASMSLPESALSQKIRRLSAEEVHLPPEPAGRCPRHLQEKINNYYKKNLQLNQIVQRRKDFRNPSIYEKLINYLGIDELGTNYPKDMYDPHSWDESSYYEGLAKTQREELQKKKEKDKKEKTKVEFVTGMVRKPQVQAPQVTSTTGIAPSLAASHGTGHEEEKKRKSKWDNPPPPQQMQPPVPLMSLPRPLITMVTAINTATVVSTTTSSTGAKTTVISSIGTIKKPKLDK